MCTIYLMRHGRTSLDVLKRSDGWLDLPLSDKGRMGLIPAQQYLKLEPLAKIYAPPLRRTQETAHIVESGVLKRPDIVPSPKAMTWNLGVLAGTPKTESKPKVKKLLAEPEEAPMGGESYNAFKGRYMDWFDARAEQVKKSGKPILIICSGSNLRLLGKMLFDDQDVMNIDEGGLVALTQMDGKWHHEVVFGDPADTDEMS
jgi:broad specificity phosphatase PhoE